MGAKLSVANPNGALFGSIDALASARAVIPVPSNRNLLDQSKNVPRLPLGFQFARVIMP
jgi:hypothetical protein